MEEIPVNTDEGVPQVGYVAESVLRMVSYDDITGLLEPAAGQNEVYDDAKASC